MFGNTKVLKISDMARIRGKERRPSTIIRDNMVHDVYDKVCGEMGKYAHYVAKQYIYEKIRNETGLCLKTIAYILNHKDREDIGLQ